MIKSLNDIPSVRLYLERIGAEAKSLRKAVITKKAPPGGGYAKEIATISIGKDGKVTCDKRYEPKPDEAQEIIDDCLAAVWPESVSATSLNNLPVDDPTEQNISLFVFRDRLKNILLVQQRLDNDKGEKRYVAWSFWSDGIWRAVEPDGKLPLWGLDGLKDHSTVFIHEGAKSAKYVRWMVDGESREAQAALAAHPWRDELVGAAHIGWIGGALSPHSTDWEPLSNGLRRAYIVSDNDQPGVSAVPAISKELDCVTFHVQFTDDWPVAFDLADSFPANMFMEEDGVLHYKGPSFLSSLQPATWATDKIIIDKKVVNKLRAHFADLWCYVEEADIFVCRDMPSIQRTPDILNNMLRPFSDVANTSDLILKAYSGRTTKLIYRPGNKRVFISEGDTAAINLHVTPNIRPQAGSPQPFIEFMDYMFPDPVERFESMRWVATLIARPDIRMTYGILLISITQGIGKTTLASEILAPLVGKDNVGWPGENDIVNSDFNGWCANKRLVVASEIYTGHSWKAYHKLKSLITDKDITVNEKFRKAYLTENWCHIFASSNSPVALRLEADDRRWFYPRVTEKPWKKEQFAELRRWLSRHGLGIILAWAMDFKSYVESGAHAPQTAAKLELIEESMSVPMREAKALAESLRSRNEPAGLTMHDIMVYMRDSSSERVYETALEVRKSMSRYGLYAYGEKVTVGQRSDYVLMNSALADAVVSIGDKDRAENIIRSKIVSPTSLLEIRM